MKTKDKIISDILSMLRQIVDSHLNINEQPLQLKSDITLTPKEIRTIGVIGKSDKINIKELGDHFNTSKSAASQIITKLSKKGFVIKRKSPDNNKEFRLQLTVEGKKAFMAYQQFHQLYISDLTKNLNSLFCKNELEKTSELLTFLRDKMENQINNIK